MKKVFATAIPLMLVLAALGGSPVIAGTQINTNATNSNYANATDSNYTRKILDMADNARIRVEALLTSIASNTTLMNNETVKSLIDEYKSGEEILQYAHGNFTRGNFNETVALSLNAMQTFREVYVELIQITGEVQNILQQGQGLLVAMNCALERLQKMNESLSTLTINIQEAKNYLEKAKELLNTTDATILLQQGNVTEVAHRLAEANRLMNQATQALKITAQERIQVRVDQYLQKLERNRERVMERLNATGINATELFTEFGFQNMGEFNQAMNSLKQMVKNHIAYGQFKNAIGSLNSMSNLTQRLNLQLQKRLALFPTPILPSQPQGEPDLQISVEKMYMGTALTLVVTVNNTGNATIVFPNSAYGVTLETNATGEWITYYTPISAQVLVSLKPGETGKINIVLSAQNNQGFEGFGKMKGQNIKPASITSGYYRVTVHGWVQGTYAPITASCEFEVP